MLEIASAIFFWGGGAKYHYDYGIFTVSIKVQSRVFRSICDHSVFLARTNFKTNKKMGHDGSVGVPGNKKTAINRL